MTAKRIIIVMPTELVVELDAEVERRQQTGCCSSGLMWTRSAAIRTAVINWLREARLAREARKGTR